MLDYGKLRKKYQECKAPAVDVVVEDKSLGETDADLIVGDVQIDLSGTYEASQAVIHIYNCQDLTTREYKISQMQPYMMLGSKISVHMGYVNTLKEVFRGFIAQVQFLNTKEDGFCMEIRAMDAKGIMMANAYVYRMKSDFYSAAVKEIFDKPVYQNLENRGIIEKFQIENTPDKNQGTQLEMSGESDYEFIVRAAKKWGFEFFLSPDTLYFRQGKKNRDNLIVLDAVEALTQWQIGYDIRGLTETVEVRSADYVSGELIQAQEKYSGKISMGNKAKGLLSQTKKVYVDGSIESVSQAKNRAEALLFAMSFRFGSLEAECVGLPELVPGHFIKIEGLGSPADNQFYVTGITHILNESKGYVTKITAVASELKGR